MFTTGEHSMRGRWLGLYLYDPLYECSAILYGLTGGDFQRRLTICGWIGS